MWSLLTIPLIIAGGGSGATCSSEGNPGLTTENGGDGDGCNGTGGSNGNGGGDAGCGCGSAGAGGFYTDGSNGSCYGGYGTGFINGGYAGVMWVVVLVEDLAEEQELIVVT